MILSTDSAKSFDALISEHHDVAMGGIFEHNSVSSRCANGARNMGK